MEYQLLTPSIPLNAEITAVERVLSNRGIPLPEISHYLNTTDEDILDPKLIANMEIGVKMLINHIAANDKIFIQIDSDCDGYTSAALLINYLNRLFPSFTQNNIIYRIHKGKEHGLIPDTIPADVKMVIAPDSSSNDYDEHKKLKEKGIDVLVIDHHETDRISPNACIINNQLCDYPTKSLSGVGMVYKFCCYIDQLLNVDYAEDYTDLAALGMIADMMDMRDCETKHITTLGLANVRNPFFRAMVEKQAFSLKGENTPMGIAFYVAPYVNATIRMGTHAEKLILFESMLDFRGYERITSTKRGSRGELEMRVDQAVRNCTNIKNRQTRARDAALESIERLIADENLLDNKILVIKLDEKLAVEKTLTGLIANQLMAKYQRPVLLLNKTYYDMSLYSTDLQPLASGTAVSWEGSGRGYDKSKFDNLREFLNESNLVLYAEGHANALGVGIADMNFNEFINYSNDKLAAFDFTPCYKVDFIFNANNFNSNDILEIAKLKPYWGQGIDEAYVALENVKISKNNITLMGLEKGKPTLKITLPNKTSLIKFKSSQEEYDRLTASECVTINVVGTCEANYFGGTVLPQILVEDYEIVNEVSWYF